MRAGTPDTSSIVGGRRPRTWRSLVPVLLPLVILIATGLRGLDFGMHWDERHYQIGPVKHMVQTGILLPNYYGYPSFVYWVNGAAALAELPRLWRGADRRERLLTVMDTHDFLLRLRAVYLVLSSLSLLWVYWLVLRWRDSTGEALVAASLLGLSWEVAYHLRWVATDSMLMQFGALTALLAVLARLEPHRPRYLYLAAIAAGLGCGTKYPGGLLIVPVAIAAICTPREGRVPRRLLGVASVFAGTYLVTTPATVLHPGPFLAALRYEIGHYASGHEGHTVGRVGEHGLRMLAYFADAVFSAWPVLALPAFGLCLIGLYAMAREGQTALVFLSFPVLYTAYFATQRAMVVRNLLVVIPFLAVVAARGAAWLWKRQHPARVIRPLTAAFVAALVLVNASWLVWAAETVRARAAADRFVRQTAAFLSSSTDVPVWVSPRLRIHLTGMGWVAPSRVVDDPRRARRLVLYASEGMTRWQEWPANRPWLTERWFGPHEVNFNVYPSWWGDDRIIVMSHRQAVAFRLLPVAPARFADSLPAESIAALVARTRSPNGASLSRHVIHPCALASRDDVARAVGPIVEGPSGATTLDGRACQYAGPRRVVSLGLLSVAAFEAHRPEAGGVVSVDIGDSAYWHSTGPNDVSLFARLDRFAIMVRVAVADDARPVEIATHLARTAVSRLRPS